MGGAIINRKRQKTPLNPTKTTPGIRCFLMERERTPGSETQLLREKQREKKKKNPNMANAGLLWKDL